MIRPMVALVDAPRTRRTDPETSREAADGNDVHGAREEVLWYLSHEPLADHELIERYTYDSRYKFEGMKHYTPQRLRTARAELVAAGRVEATGIYRLTPTGGKANVWQLKEVNAS